MDGVIYNNIKELNSIKEFHKTEYSKDSCCEQIQSDNVLQKSHFKNIITQTHKRLMMRIYSKKLTIGQMLI